MDDCDLVRICDSRKIINAEISRYSSVHLEGKENVRMLEHGIEISTLIHYGHTVSNLLMYLHSIHYCDILASLQEPPVQ